jgi:murein DD-endopeptidase MepM/ murein hydrolase activator NlpD
VTQIYLHDRTTGRATLLTRGADGRPGDGNSVDPTLSGDGRVAAFASDAANLVVGDTNQATDIFTLDLESGAILRASVASGGTQANRAALAPALALDGQTVAFISAASNLVNGDGNGVADLFVHDRRTRHTSRASVAVIGPWTGVEANGPTQGPAALTAEGHLLAFVAAATNLVPAGTDGVADLFLHSRTDPPSFALSGQVLDGNRAPLAGVEVAAGPQRAVTDEAGYYAFPALVGGAYTLAVARPGYTFAPSRRTVSLLADTAGQDFVAYPSDDPAAFLDLPFAYDDRPSTLLQLLRDTDEGGLVDSWFDHDAPNYGKNGAVLLWDGRPRRAEPYNDVLGCYERRCYDGHDGVDFPYRDADPTTAGYEPIAVRPAAAGLVAHVVNACADQGPRCNGGYGNEVILYHDNGYFTRYSHLERVDAPDDPAWLTRESTLGVMGATGNSFGTHLHFAVHQDDGNGRWDGGAVDRPVDPFGWTGAESDPWAAAASGPLSRRLWRYSSTAEVVLFGSQGATLRDGADSITANVPPGAFAGQARIELTTGHAPAVPDAPWRSLGRAFDLRMLEWLGGGPDRSSAALARPVELAVRYAGADTRHLALDQMGLYRWQPATATWEPLPTAVDAAAQVAYSASDQLGEFDLQAPLLCPSDGLEPDDGYFAAVYIKAGHTALTRVFDVAEDEDWLRLDATAGVAYAVVVDEMADGVAPVVEIYDVDGLTRLAANGAGTLRWQPDADGTYFVRVAPGPGSAVGCAAEYRVAVRGAE